MAKKSKGIGDDIARFTEKTGLSKAVKLIFGDDCGCKERQEKLNKLFPNYKNIRSFTKDEKQIYENVMSNVDKTNTIEAEQKMIIGRLYRAVFESDAQWSNCGSCNKKTLDNLRKIYEKSCDK